MGEGSRGNRARKVRRTDDSGKTAETLRTELKNCNLTRNELDTYQRGKSNKTQEKTQTVRLDESYSACLDFHSADQTFVYRINNSILTDSWPRNINSETHQDFLSERNATVLFPLI